MSSPPPLRVLLVEDNPADARLIQELLREARPPHPEVVTVPRLAQALELLRPDAVDVVLLDLSLPDASGSQTVATAHAYAPSVPIVVLTGLDDEDAALAAMQKGAQDYLIKGRVDAALLMRAMRYAIERRRADEHARGFVREQTARLAAEASATRWRVLAETSEALGATFDVDEMLTRAGRLIAGSLVDVCLVDLVEGRGLRRVAACAHPDVDRTSLEALSQHHGLAAIRARKALVVDPLTDDALQSVPGGRVHLSVTRPLKLRRAALVPLSLRGQVLGCLSLWRSGDQTFTRTELATFDALASRMSVAIENARLYQARDEVLAIVSHDLRNPLNVITFALRVLRLKAPPPPGGVAQLEKVERAVTEMNRLIEDLLDIHKLESSGLPLSPGRVEVASLLAEAVESIRALAEKKQVTLSHFADPYLPPVQADRARTLQVFSNLLGNAIKFTPEGGQIEVRALPEEGQVRFFVRDTGPGIDPLHLPRVFDRFYKAAARGEGVGLGLAIAKGIVSAHGGQIGVESQPGEGSTFWFTLPSHAASHPAAAAEAR